MGGPGGAATARTETRIVVSSVLTGSSRSALFGGPAWLSVAVAAAFFAFCLLLQITTGARRADFAAHPDEASHFVGSVMVRDYLASGRLADPLAFARGFYSHYPFFAVGYWPPAFYSVTAFWFWIAGVGRTQALLVPAVFAAGTAWLIFFLVRLRAGPIAGICTGALYLSLPSVQQWMCAVMVDHFTAFFCVAGAACLLRYLEAPNRRIGLLCAACCACAVLSKYSAAYLVALPLLAAWLGRRRSLWRRPSLFLQPVVVALVVGPWVLWTRHLASYGLPAEKQGLTLARVASVVGVAFRIFPPVLMAAVVLGLIALLFLPKLWREDVAMIGLLGAGQLALLLASPVEAEGRYVLVSAASLLVLSAAGWAGVWSSIPQGARPSAVPFAAAGLVVLFVVFHFGTYPRPPECAIRTVVQSLQQNPAWLDKRIVVPPDLEGPFIAEFVAQDRQRPSYYLLRPSKFMASMNWFGGDYRSRFGSSEEAMNYLRDNRVELIVWHTTPDLTPHERILADVLRDDRGWWRRIALFGSGPASWSVYQRAFQTGESTD